MRTLRIGSQNIQGGIVNKLSSIDDKLYIEICRHDIYCVQEAWVSEDQMSSSPIPEVKGYKCYTNLRNKGRKTRVFGGNIVYFRKEFDNKYIRKLGSNYNDFLWVWLDGKHFNLPTDLYLCSVYLPHEKSSIHDIRKSDPFQVLAEETAHYQQKGMVMYIGDFNSRTGLSPEDWNFISNPAELPGHHSFSLNDDTSDIPKRHNEDTGSNLFGPKLLKLCETLGLVVLNGRIPGDFFGKMTFHGPTGSSAIDYAVCSLPMFRYIQSLQVHKLDWFSDHCRISVTFNRSYLVDWVNTDTENDITGLAPHSNYIWDEESKKSFTNFFNTDALTQEIKRIDQTVDLCDVDSTCSSITELVQSVADNSCKAKTLSTNKSDVKPKNKIPEQFRTSLRWAKHNFSNAVDSYRSRTGDQNRRHTMIKCRKSLKNLIYLIGRYKKEDKVKKIASLENKNPKQFWSHIKHLTKKQSNQANISASKWYVYFKGLLNVNATLMDQDFLKYVQHALPVLEKNSYIDPELNQPITVQEVIKVIRTLKNGKAAGLDKISNEMIKSAGPSFHVLLTKFYNKILTSGHHPQSWKRSIISTIYKKGDADLPTNYRGVAVSSALHKVLTKVLNKRIVTFMTMNEKWSNYQNGFMEKRRTEDNIFILHSLFNKYVRRSESKIYVAFIDFRKFFDIINRDHLMYKLLGTGITGPVYNTIKSMYQGTQFCIKTDLGLTDFFDSNSGVLQGCNLSPTLSNIFQTDIHKLFGKETDPLTLKEGVQINSLSWADDLVLMSTSHKGLQTCLNRLNEYCKKWGLSINVNKTKIMIMEKGRSINTNREFSLSGEPVECVQSYKYLGVIINYNGTFKKSMEDRITKATKCVYMIRNAISHYTNISTRLATTLFDKQVAPILTYGCPLWSLPKSNNSLRISMRLDRYANVQVKNAVEGLVGQPVNIERSVIDRAKSTVTITLYTWEEKISILNAIHRTPFSGIIENPESEYEFGSNIDKVHARMLKFSLGVSKYTSNTAVFRELGQVPISIKAKMLTAMYFYRFYAEIHADNHFLLNAAFSCMKEYSDPWIDSVHYLFAKHGMSDLYKSIITRGVTKGKLKRLFLERLSDIYIQYNNSKMQEKPFLKDLYQLTEGKPYKKQNYLNVIASPQTRMIYSRIRTNSSKLSPSPYLETSDRCDSCNVTMDFKHLLLDCNKTMRERDKFINTIHNLNYGINTDSDGFYHNIMNMDWPALSDEQKLKVTPIVLGYVGVIGRGYVI